MIPELAQASSSLDWAALGFFSLAALLGMYLLSFVMTRKETPKGVAIAHGLVAAIGLVLLIVYVAGPGPDPLESVVLFAMAAIGGFVVLMRDLSGGPPPRWLAIAHGVTALLGYIFLLVHLFSSERVAL